MKIVIGSDHGGFQLKEILKAYLKEKGYKVEDIGAFSEESSDYPDYAFPAATMVAGGKADKGILICGSGIGMCIAANKVKGIRAALVYNEDVARLAGEHNDANIICLPGRYMDEDTAKRSVDVWLKASVTEARHLRRVAKLIREDK